MDKEKKQNRSAGRIVLFVISILFLLWFLLSILTGIKPNIGNLTGIAVFAVLALYALFLPNVNQFLKRLWKTKAGKAAEIAFGIILAAVFSFAAITFACMLQAAGNKPVPDSTIIVLGCKVNGHNPSLTLDYRLQSALDYLRDNPDSACIVTGAQGQGEIVTEASVMYQRLLEEGIPEDRLLKEEEASDTMENLTFSLALLKEHPDLSQKTTIVTSDFHVYRATENAKRLGMETGSISSPTPWWLYPTYVVREMYGILELWFLT